MLHSIKVDVKINMHFFFLGLPLPTIDWGKKINYAPECLNILFSSPVVMSKIQCCTKYFDVERHAVCAGKTKD